MNDFDTNQTLYELAKQRDLAQTQLSIATEALADIVAQQMTGCGQNVVAELRREAALTASPAAPSQAWYERAVKARNALANSISQLRGGHSAHMDGCDLALAELDIVLGLAYPCFDAVKVAAGALKAVNDAGTK